MKRRFNGATPNTDCDLIFQSKILTQDIPTIEKFLECYLHKPFRQDSL